MNKDYFLNISDNTKQLKIKTYKSSSTSTNSIMLSLYLVLLVFFIVISHFHKFDKERALMISESINNQFFKNDANDLDNLNKQNINSLSPYFKKIYRIFSLINQEINLIDDQMTLTVSIAQLYEDNSVQIKNEYIQYFEQISQFIANNTFNSYLPHITYYILDKEENLSINAIRAENFIKTLKLNPKNTIIGFSPKDTAKIKITFSIEKVDKK